MAYGDGKRKERIAIIAVSSIVLVAMIVAIVGVTMSQNKSDDSGNGKGDVSSSVKAIKAICQPTDYQEACEKSLQGAGESTDPKELLKAAFNFATKKFSNAAKESQVLKELEKDPRTSAALETCKDLMNFAIDEFKTSFDKVGGLESADTEGMLADLKIWVSAAMTYQETCLDGFENTTGQAAEKMKELLKTTNELTSNALAMVTEISSIFSSVQISSLELGHSHRRLLTEADDVEVLGHGEFPIWEENGRRRLLTDAAEELEVLGHGEFPNWFEYGRRKLLHESQKKVKPNVVVAKDGSGNCSTIKEALKHIPNRNKNTFVIYVREGVYEERVEFTKEMTHVVLIGDGQTKTKITGNLNFADGIQTCETATVKVFGDHFMARDIGFENTAGPNKHQAVALRVQADFAVFYRCQMDGYQDTLYVHAKRQFYRDCTISGTIDFIFGDAASIFQNCTLLVRKPMPNQFCAVTAQGRKDRRQPSAIVLQGCTITAAPEYLSVKEKTKTYLGRPWKEYARTVIMESYIDDVIHPEGWTPWAGTVNTVKSVSAEYKNTGPGSSIEQRVKWPGIKKLDDNRILKYTGKVLLRPDNWVAQSGVPYVEGLLNQNPSSPSPTLAPSSSDSSPSPSHSGASFPSNSSPSLSPSDSSPSPAPYYRHAPSPSPSPSSSPSSSPSPAPSPQ